MNHTGAWVDANAASLPPSSVCRGPKTRSVVGRHLVHRSAADRAFSEPFSWIPQQSYRLRVSMSRTWQKCVCAAEGPLIAALKWLLIAARPGGIAVSADFRHPPSRDWHETGSGIKVPLGNGSQPVRSPSSTRSAG